MSIEIIKCRSPHRVVLAQDLKEGMWLTYKPPGHDQRIVGVSSTRDGQIKLHIDYGNGGEPATQFIEKTDRLCVRL